MATQLGTSRKTVRNIIKHALKKNIRVKAKVHVLNESQKANRKTNARRLYEDHLAGDK